MRPLNLYRRLASPAIVFAVALASGLAITTASAQPVPPGAHMRGGNAAMGGEGMAIVRLRDRLNLSADQSAALDSILAGAKVQAQAFHQSAQPTLAQIAAELAKPQPSLQVIAQLRDSLQPQRDALHKAARDKLIAFYATLNGTQQQVVIDAMRKMAAWRGERVARHLAR